MQKKIYVGKNDEAAAVAEQIIDAEAEEIVLSVPKFSRLAGSEANFHLLKREAEVLGKKLVVESVDDVVLASAKRVGLASLDPFFGRTGRQLSDIVVQRGQEKKKEHDAPRHTEELPRHAEEGREARRHETRPRMSRSDENSRRTPREWRFPKLRGRKMLVGGILAVLLLAGTGYFLLALPYAEIRLTRVKTAWSFKDTVVADTAVNAADAAGKRIPAQRLSQTKNITLSFPATGKKQVQRRASGKITIYNAFSSAPQALVAQTRFEAPDGKIFRLAKSTVVPAARVVAGKIEPSSVAADAVADQAGEAYNIGPVERFTIPGFASTPKFSGFYAKSSNPMTGGIVGQVAFPTNEDMRKAKDTVAQTLSDATKNLSLAQLPPQLKLLKGADEFKIVNEKTDADAGSDGKFSIFAEAQMTLIAFQESDLLAMLAERARGTADAGLTVKNQTLNYGDAHADAANGRLSFAVDYQGTFVRGLSSDVIKQQIIGLSEQDLRARLLAVPGLETAQVSLWPFWVRRVPQNLERIKVDIE